MRTSTWAWQELTESYGKPDTAHRQLWRWMQAVGLDTRFKAARRPEFAGLRLRICRAWLGRQGAADAFHPAGKAPGHAVRFALRGSVPARSGSVRNSP